MIVTLIHISDQNYRRYWGEHFHHLKFSPFQKQNRKKFFRFFSSYLTIEFFPWLISSQKSSSVEPHLLTTVRILKYVSELFLTDESGYYKAHKKIQKNLVMEVYRIWSKNWIGFLVEEIARTKNIFYCQWSLSKFN